MMPWGWDRDLSSLMHKSDLPRRMPAYPWSEPAPGWNIKNPPSVGYGRSKRRTLFLGQVRRMPAYLCLEAATARKRQNSNVFRDWSNAARAGQSVIRACGRRACAAGNPTFVGQDCWWFAVSSHLLCEEPAIHRKVELARYSTTSSCI